MNIRERINNCIALVLRIDPIKINIMKGDEPLILIGIDSLNCMELVVNIEEEFGINFCDDELLLDNLNSINKLSKIIEKKLNVSVGNKE